MKLNIFIFNFKCLSILVCLLINASSCKKFVDLPTPPDAVGSDNVFSDSATATSVILGLYADMASGTLDQAPEVAVGYASTVYGAMSADEGFFLTNSTYDAFKDNTLTAGNSTSLLFSGLYARISRANYAIEGLNVTSSLSDNLRNRLLGEAKFIRAWNYFYLVNFFGEVPLVISTDARSTSLLPKTDTATVYAQIRTDLIDAKSLLGTNYPTADRARANSLVAAAMLSRVYFFQSNWQGAEAEASEVINSGLYELEPLSNVFLKDSRETIWQISTTTSSTPATVFGAEFIPLTETPTFVLYDTLANSFEANDGRKNQWLQSVNYVGKEYYYPFKYKVQSTNDGVEYPVMIRLAELYLTRAEARANLNNIVDAADDLNKVRDRAGLLETDATTQEELLINLLHERWVELFTEFSDRWFNLKRLEKAREVLSPIKPSWEDFQALYPLPQEALTANPNLVNNEGY